VTQNGQPCSVEEALAKLSRERASEDFTQRVLDGLVHRRPSKLAAMSPRWAVTLATLAAFGLALGFWLRSYLTIEPTVQEDRAGLIRQEYESIQDEVAALRSLAAQPPPVLYLGGDSQIDLVLDLGQGGFEPTKLDIRPTAAPTRRAAPEGRRIQ
jgi:hypothetical protein